LRPAGVFQAGAQYYQIGPEQGEKMIFTRDRRRKYVRRAALASTLAAAAGYVTGILTAPKSGKDTRQDIKLAADKAGSEAEKDLRRAQAELDAAVTAAKANSSKLGKKAQAELNELLEKAKDSKTKSGQVLTAIRAG